MHSEAAYQTKLIKKLKTMFPGCYVQKNDPTQNQGIPDIFILFNDRWAALEIKISATSNKQPNQEHYVGVFNNMSYAAFIFPENEQEILDELQSALGVSR